MNSPRAGGQPWAVPLDDNLDMGNLRAHWDLVTQTAARVQAVAAQPHTSALTARKFDEAQTAGHRVYLAAEGHLAAAVEHQLALEHLLTHGATPLAPYTLLRGAFERGFWALWVLDPDDGPERRWRGLHQEVVHAQGQRAMAKNLLKYDAAASNITLKGLDETGKSYRAEVSAMGRSWTDAIQKIRVGTELLHLVHLPEPGLEQRAALAAWWSFLSAIQHGADYAMLQGTTQHGPSQPRLGGQNQTRAIRDEWFRGAATITNMVVLAGLNLLERRCTRP